MLIHYVLLIPLHTHKRTLEPIPAVSRSPVNIQREMVNIIKLTAHSRLQFVSRPVSQSWTAKENAFAANIFFCFLTASSNHLAEDQLPHHTPLIPVKPGCLLLTRKHNLPYLSNQHPVLAKMLSMFPYWSWASTEFNKFYLRVWAEIQSEDDKQLILYEPVPCSWSG